MSDIEVRRWENEFLEISIWMIRVGKKFYFFGRELAIELGYTDPTKTIQTRIDFEEKKSMDEILGPNYRRILERSLEELSLKSNLDKISKVDFFQRIRGHQKLVTEFALYYFCATSKKDKAKPFHKWIFSTIMEIREKGFYNLPYGPLENPLDLIAKVSNLEKEIKTFKRETITYDKSTQTRESVIIVKNSLRELEKKIEKSIRKTRFNLEKSLGEISPCSSSSSSSRHSSSSDSE